MKLRTNINLNQRDIRFITNALWHYYKDLHQANMPLTAQLVAETGTRFLKEVTLPIQKAQRKTT
jgi:hypothetical protein